MQYGNIIKNIREENGLTQEDVAKILGIKRVTFGHYETQEQLIPIKHLIKFSIHFKISIDYIIQLSSNKFLNSSTYEINKTEIGKRLKEIRKECNVTQEWLANLLNTTKSVICDYERGRYLISTPFLYTICKELKISADYLLGKVDEPKYLK